MSNIDWILHALELLVLVVVLPVGGILLRNWIKSSIQHRYNEQLEYLKHELRDYGSQIESTRNSILEMAGAYRNAVERRRLQAVDEIWKGTLTLKRFASPTVELLAHLDIETVVERPEGPKVKDSFQKSFQFSPSPKEIAEEQSVVTAREARPWVSPLIWTTFTAYEAIVVFSTTQALLFKKGLDPRVIQNPDKTEKFVQFALKSTKFENVQFNNASCPALLEQLESELLFHFQKTISSEIPPQESVEQITEFNRLFSEMHAEHYENQKKLDSQRKRFNS